jgi:S1-C subfamily serine protease
MEHLTKQQIVLLTLFVSFVTSIATGIVSVSLMGQAPMGVTQTIERVVSDSDTTFDSKNIASAIVAVDPITNAVDKISKSIVRIKPVGSNIDQTTGLGIVVSSDGVIVTDKAVVAPQGNLVAMFSDGQEFPIQVIQSQNDGDIVFIIVDIPAVKKPMVIVPAPFAVSIKLGQTVLALHGKNLDGLSQGIVKKNTEDPLTSVDSADLIVGSPLFTVNGELIGLKTTGLQNSFYSVSNIKKSIPVFNSVR